MEEFEVNKKAIRIHHYERLKHKRSKYNNNWVGVLHTPKPCNCWMCSKPKKHTLSTQELRDYQPKLQDLEINNDWLRENFEKEREDY